MGHLGKDTTREKCQQHRDLPGNRLHLRDKKVRIWMVTRYLPGFANTDSSGGYPNLIQGYMSVVPQQNTNFTL